MSAATELPPGPELPPYRLEDSVGHLLRRAHQRHGALFQLCAGGESGLTPTQFATLLRLAELGRATQNRLGREVALDTATIAGVVQRLVLRGLLATTRDPQDRRAVVLQVTRQGQAVLAEAVRQGDAANAALLAPLSPAERDLLAGLLRRVLGA
jgi:DNA-binding MarR family transcriptional regulator